LASASSCKRDEVIAMLGALIFDSAFKEPIQLRTVIPGRAKREPGIHNHDRKYGFRACAKWRIPE
jgi:hypothetical protein